MIRVLHNQVEREIDPAAFANIEEAVASFPAESGEREVITALRVNGCAVAEERMTALDHFGLEGVDAIEVETCAPRQVAIQTLIHTAEYAASIQTALGRAVEDFRASRVIEANELCAILADSFAVWSVAVTSIAAALQDDGAELADLDRELQPWLQELVEAQVRRDWVSVGDLMEYELLPRVGVWEQRLLAVHGTLCAQATQ